MGEKIGMIPCPDCGEPAELFRDKRRKLYIVHPAPDGCGRFTYNTNSGQARLQERWNKLQQQAEEVEAEVELGQIVQTIVHTLESEGYEVAQDVIQGELVDPPGDNEPGDKKGGLLAIVVGFFIGGALWLTRQQQ